MAVRVCRGVRGLETKVRIGLEGFGGGVRAEWVWGRDADGGRMAEEGRRSRSLGVAFMLAGLLRGAKWVTLSILVTNMYEEIDGASDKSVQSPDLHHDVSIERSQFLDFCQDSCSATPVASARNHIKLALSPVFLGVL